MTAKDVIEFAYKGETYECDKKAARSWKNIRAISKGGAPMFDAMDEILCGKSDEVAEAVGDDFIEVSNVVAAAVEAAGAKN